MRNDQKKKSDGVTVHHEIKSDGMTVQHQTRGDGVKVYHEKERWGESSR